MGRWRGQSAGRGREQRGTVLVPVIHRVLVLILLSFILVRVAAEASGSDGVKLRFLRTDPETGRPIPFISSTDPNADVYCPSFGSGPMFPSIVELPRANDITGSNRRTSSRSIKRVHPDANFYLYYAAHNGNHIAMAWSHSLDGPWVEYNNPKFCEGVPAATDATNNNCKRGVMPLPQPGRWDHVSAPHVSYNPKHNRFVMIYHGKHFGRGGHSSFIASSGDGIDFSGGYIDGSLMDGQGTAMRLLSNGRRRPVILGTNYSRSFDHDADGDGKPEHYFIGKRGKVCKLPHNIYTSGVQTWANNSQSPFQNVAKCDELPENIFHIPKNAPSASGFVYKYMSPLTEFLASKEFANHENNPHRGETVHSFVNMTNKRLAYDSSALHFANHVGIWKPRVNVAGTSIAIGGAPKIGNADLLEVYFYVKSPKLRSGKTLETYQGLYRVIYDLRDYRTEQQKQRGVEPFETWRPLVGPDGKVLFDVVVSPDLGLGAAGDSFAHTFNDGRKYLFFSTGPEGNIYGAEFHRADETSSGLVWSAPCGATVFSVVAVVAVLLLGLY